MAQLVYGNLKLDKLFRNSKFKIKFYLLIYQKMKAFLQLAMIKE